MKHQREREIHRATQRSRESAQGLFRRGACGLLREAEDGDLTDKLTFLRKLAGAPVGT